MRSGLSRTSAIDRLLLGLAAVCLCTWGVVGLGLYKYGLFGWPVFLGGLVGGLGMFLLATGLARIRWRNGAKPEA